MPVAHRALHRADDIALLTHPAQDRFEIAVERPTAGSLLTRKAKLRQCAQPPGAQRLLGWIAMHGAHESIFIDRAEQAAVDASEAMLVDLIAAGRVDLGIGTWAKVEVDQFGGALAQPMAEIIAGNDEILAAFVFPPDDDVGVGMAGV